MQMMLFLQPKVGTDLSDLFWGCNIHMCITEYVDTEAIIRIIPTGCSHAQVFMGYVVKLVFLMHKC